MVADSFRRIESIFCWLKIKNQQKLTAEARDLSQDMHQNSTFNLPHKDFRENIH